MSLLDRLEKQKILLQQTGEKTASSTSKRTPFVDEFSDFKSNAHREVVEYLNRNPVDQHSKTPEQTQDEVFNVIETIVAHEGTNLPRADRLRISRELYDEIVGLGPLQPLLSDPTISEIMVNGADHIFVEKNGNITLSETRFRDNQHVMNVIERIVSSIGRRIDESSPMVDARLKDGSRVNAIIPPLSLTGPIITIRKFARDPIQASHLISFGSLSMGMVSFLEACVKGRINIIVSGGTGSGKTTLLNVLSSFIPDDERIITIEDAAELQLRQQHVITLESRPANLEGRGQITIRDLVRNSLRMRPDRIIVGEVRSGEALDMLQAMNTGHDGSLTTAHANSPRDVLSRLETMVLMAGMDLPIRAIREQIAAAINIVVQQSRMRDGSRKVISICEITGMEGDIISMQEIFSYKQNGIENNKIKGKFSSTGIQPAIVAKLRNNGVPVNDDWFSS